MRTTAALGIVALAGTLAGCNHNTTRTMNDRDSSGSSRTAYHAGPTRTGVVKFTGYDDRGGAVESGPAVVTAGDWRAEDPYSHRGYDDREVFHDGHAAPRGGDGHAVGSGTYDDRSSVNAGTTATHRDAWPSTASASPDARILSILHAKNQEEIKLGRLAQQNGQSQEVKEYGQMLVRDHSANDAKVVQTARDAGLSLMSADEVKEMCAGEKGKNAPDADPMAQLQNKTGAEFDIAFSKLMEDAHQDVIAMVEDARTRVTNPQVRTLLADTLPKLRQHENHAETLASVHDDDR